MTQATARIFTRPAIYLGLALFAGISLLPLYWLAISSFKSQPQIFVIPPHREHLSTSSFHHDAAGRFAEGTCTERSLHHGCQLSDKTFSCATPVGRR